MNASMNGELWKSVNKIQLTVLRFGKCVHPSINWIIYIVRQVILRIWTKNDPNNTGFLGSYYLESIFHLQHTLLANSNLAIVFNDTMLYSSIQWNTIGTCISIKTNHFAIFLREGLIPNLLYHFRQNCF